LARAVFGAGPDALLGAGPDAVFGAGPALLDAGAEAVFGARPEPVFSAVADFALLAEGVRFCDLPFVFATGAP
jgi:hypothetical protein